MNTLTDLFKPQPWVPASQPLKQTHPQLLFRLSLYFRPGGSRSAGKPNFLLNPNTFCCTVFPLLLSFYFFSRLFSVLPLLSHRQSWGELERKAADQGFVITSCIYTPRDKGHVLAHRPHILQVPDSVSGCTGGSQV